MFVSMATAAVNCVKMLSTDDLVSCLVVKCMGIVIATSLPNESKDQILSTVEASLRQILDWCLESLHKVGFTSFTYYYWITVNSKCSFFLFGEVYCPIYGQKFSFTAMRERSSKT